ncbi:hypothetical protein LN650_00355 [Klebsiella pneumoniae subsp. pneumoniae]|nr:hypothetical protein [Klebsiella pneumoniae subsp. pneumoniae]
MYCAFNDLDEARFVVNRIKTWQENGGALEQCAILYRSNAQSRVLGRRPSCRPVCRTVSTAACASSSVRKSKTRALLPAPYRQPQRRRGL